MMKWLVSIVVVCSTAAGWCQTADTIVVLKSKREMQLLSGGKVLRTYKVALGSEPVGAKHFQGDHRTPEGVYRIDFRNEHSQYYKALHVSYPNAADRAYAAKFHNAAGGDIMIHGLPKAYAFVGAAHRLHDWTDGCVAVTDQEMDEIWRLVPAGVRVEIKP